MKRKLMLLFFFSIAMGFMESTIVIYLRELYYPNGFDFPLTVIPPRIAIVEILREAATLIMLVTMGMLIGKNAFQRLTIFLFCFAIWDLIYYIFLKLFLDWPESLFTYDILFLIPVPWVGPVIAPCLLSLTMLSLSAIMLRNEKRKIEVKLKRTEWMLFISGTLIVIISFVWDYIRIACNVRSQSTSMSSSIVGSASGEELFSDFMNYIPQSYNWILFLAGEALILWSIFRIEIQSKKFTPKNNEMSGES